MQLNITNELLDEARELCNSHQDISCNCVLALAIQRQHNFPNAFVGLTVYCLDIHEQHEPLSEDAYDMRQDFDDWCTGNKPKPAPKVITL